MRELHAPITHRPALLGLGLLMALAGGSARADLMYGVTDFTPQLYTIDSTTGAVQNIQTIKDASGALGFGQMEDVVPDGQGGLLAASNKTGSAIGAWELARINPVTAIATGIGPITSAPDRAYWVEGMAWVNGTLYASAAAFNPTTNPPTYFGYAPDTSYLLIKIDPTTGHATEVGAFGSQFLNVEDLAYSPKYGLIGSDIGTLNPDPNQPNGQYSSYHTTPALIRIDPLTGQATKLADLPTGPLVTNPYNSFLSPGGPYVAGLDFSPDGNTLYGVTGATHFGGTHSDLVTIDLATGALTTVATYNFDTSVTGLMDGITFASTGVVPEPASAALLALGLAGAGLWLRRGGRGK